MAGLINWRKVAPPGSNPDSNHLYVGVDPVDCKLYIKDDAGTIFKYETDADVTSAINLALADYDLSTVVDSKISAAITSLIDGAPTTLDTLNELAAALTDDANFAATVTTQLGLKYDASNPAGYQTAAEVSTAASGAVTTHVALADPHPQYSLDSDLSAGLALKYDSSNPNGYETPTQLNTRDTNNRARANHTGTQLASSISNFAVSVTGTVLTGLSLATNAVISATDTVLSALGKLQAQLTQVILDVNAAFGVVNGRLDALEARVFGTEFQDFLDTVVSTTTSAAQPLTAVASTFTTTSVPAGEYRIGLHYNFTTNSTTADSRFALFVDGTQIGLQHNEELQDATSNKNDQIIVSATLGAGAHTIQLRFGSEGGITTTVNRVDCEFWRVS